MKRYNPADIETKWQKKWEESKIFQANNASAKPKYYALSFFPYPSGVGLHIGHTRNFTITDVAARAKRMQGYEVLQPMGWDSFGLPGENYAIKTGISPQVSTKQNTDNFRAQCKRLGLSIDWTREFSSTDPEYYKWTQWFFLLLLEKGLAYRQESAQWWCNECKTVLANEQVVNGCCWRHEDKPVSKKLLNQWFFKITDYADRLTEDLDDLDWPEGIKLMQKNWIGKSTGAEVNFAVKDSIESLKIFTTRPDTIYGATFMVVAPEHPMVEAITTPETKSDVQNYINSVANKTDIERQEDSGKKKTGVFSGSYAINPLTKKEIPIWISDFVLMGYGTGAIMSVPAHDERDYEFAKTFGLEITKVIDAGQEDDAVYSGEGLMVNSGKFNGQKSSEAREKIIKEIVSRNLGTEKVNYKIRDWLISRQRYWGAPIPVVYCQKDGIVPLPVEQLPLRLPKLDNFQPSGDGRSPLARADDWVNTTCPKCGGPAVRETDTMDGFACSSWYFLRFADPTNNKEPFSKKLADHWLPVDLYVGGAEHAVMHLLYARMWTKVMQDSGLINFGEPFKALRNQGMLLAADGQKISKSKGNDIKPEDIIDQGYGADSLRMIVLFLAPFDMSTPWSNEGLAGVYKFLQRVWSLVQQYLETSVSKEIDENEGEILSSTHRAIKKVSQDIEAMSFNTAIAALMKFTNELYDINKKDNFSATNAWQFALNTLIQLLAPFAPHITEELWSNLGNTGSVHISTWPVHDEGYLVQNVVKIAVMVNGKVRGEIEVPVDSEQEIVEAESLKNKNASSYIENADVKKIIFVKNKIINFVI
jgi:leucyl-tRNA synthetase